MEVVDPNAEETESKLGQALAKSMHGELIAEYEALLTTTLEAQRHHYDAQLASCVTRRQFGPNRRRSETPRAVVPSCTLT